MLTVKTKFILTTFAIALSITVFSRHSSLYALEKFSVAGWSKPISEITNLLRQLMGHGGPGDGPS